MKDCHPSVFFNDTIVERSTNQKHLGIHLDEKLDFNAHIKEKISKAYRGIGIIKKLQSKLPRNALLTIYKSFIRPHLDYGDIVYNQPTNDSFCKNLESAQYNAALAITGAIKGTSQGKLYKESFFDWDSFHARLNSQYKAWSYKKHKKIKAHRKSV